MGSNYLNKGSIGTLVMSNILDWLPGSTIQLELIWTICTCITRKAFTAVFFHERTD